MAVLTEGQTESNIDTPDIGWGHLFYDRIQKRYCFKSDDGVVKCFLPAEDETLTTLDLNANILTYVDENGDSTNIDLSLYLDDTNLARLTSGTIDSQTGIATFTRDDSSTFDVDFSSLIDIETLTTLELNGTDLDYVDENGDTTTIDLSSFLDDTNLARIVTAQFIGQDLILTRDDSSQMIVDLSSLNVAETLTTIEINGNIVTYTDENGAETDIDLSHLLDDTNLARLVSGSFNPTTNIITLTRDDATDFDIDISSFSVSETITTLTESPSEVFTYTSEDSTQTVIDVSAKASQADLDNHTGDTSNPHDTTITQAVAADAGTDITTAELETLTNASNADALHNHSIQNFQFNETSLFNATGSYTQIGSMSLTNLPLGTYLVHFSCAYELGNDDAGNIGLFYNGSLIAHSSRPVSIDGNGLISVAANMASPCHTMAVITINDASDTIVAGAQETTGTLQINERMINATKIG